MSKNITQNNIIMWLEDVVPQMQKSASPVDCLLKYAKEHNFSPAILERVGHMFNSLKTNSAYNLAKEASHRGDYISTLDVPALLEKYSSFDNDIDYDNLITNFNRWNIAEGESQTLKLASTNQKVGDVKDLCVFKHIDEEESHKKLESFYNKQQIQKTAASNKSSKPVLEFWEVIKLASELKDSAINIASAANLNQCELVDKFASKHIRNQFKDYDRFDFNIKNFIDDELFSESLNKFAKALKSKSPAYSKLVKTASETGLDKKLKLGNSAELNKEDVNIVFEFHNNCRLNKIASELNELGDNILKFAAAGSTTFDLDQIKDQIKQVELDLTDFVDNALATDGRFSDRSKYTIDLLKVKLNDLHRLRDGLIAEQRKEIDRQRTEARDAYLKEEKDLKEKADLERKLRLESKSDSEKNLKDVAEGFNTISEKTIGGIKDIANGVKSSISDVNGSLQDLYSRVESMKNEGRVSELRDPIKAEMDKIEAQSILQQLLFSDPILSKLNDNEVDNLMESYNTIVNRNPSIALDKGLLRTVLRQAANIQGIDANTIDTIKRI